MPQITIKLNEIDSTAMRNILDLPVNNSFPVHFFKQAGQLISQTAIPRASWLTYAYDPDNDMILAEPAVTLTASTLATRLSGACQIAILAFTLGTAVSTALAEKIQTGDYTAALLGNAAARAALVQVCSKAQTAISQQAFQSGFEADAPLLLCADKEQTLFTTMLALAEGNCIDITIKADDLLQLVPSYSQLAVIAFRPYQYSLNMPANSHELLNPNQLPPQCQADMPAKYQTKT